MRFCYRMRRWFFKSMAALLMVSLGAGAPGMEALDAARYQLFLDVSQPSVPTRGPAVSRMVNLSGRYYGSHPAADVYVTQTIKHTCTLVAATMMIRNYACQRGTPYAFLTSSRVSRYCWTKKYGLSRSFRVGQVEVACTPEIGGCKDKKQYLINALRKHREGVVIYDTGAPHAIWLFGYDAATDTFWCADTIKSRGGHAIPLQASIIKGATQQDKVDTIDKIWYIVERNATNDGRTAETRL